MLVSIYVSGRIFNHSKHLDLWPRSLLPKLNSSHGQSKHFAKSPVDFIVLFGSMDQLQAF